MTTESEKKNGWKKQKKDSFRSTSSLRDSNILRILIFFYASKQIHHFLYLIRESFHFHSKRPSSTIFHFKTLFSFPWKMAMIFFQLYKNRQSSNEKFCSNDTVVQPRRINELTIFFSFSYRYYSETTLLFFFFSKFCREIFIYRKITEINQVLKIFSLSFNN